MKRRQQLAVTARTRYNAFQVPAMAPSGTLTREGETVDWPFERPLDPELDYRYGGLVDGIMSGDELALSVEVPPQVARHQGCETAFLNTPTESVTL